MNESANPGSRRRGRALAAALAVLLGAGACSWPEPAASASAPPDPAVRGRTLFGAYCAGCHGSGARGDGPQLSQPRPAAADLTAIAARQGRFDLDRVAAYIDGRRDVAQHGPREMPVWGRVALDDRLERSLEEELRLTGPMISDIVAYLQSLQGR